MRRALVIAFVCSAGGLVAAPSPTPARLPMQPGAFGPSLVKIDSSAPRTPGEVSEGTQLSDVDSCATCHPAAAAQWSASAHSFASFGNPIYRVNVELARTQLGNDASRHCGGCHDMPLMVDGMMAGKIPADDLRAHSGVSCSLCHGVESVSKDGNGSYVWSRAPIDAPNLHDPASIAKHRAQASVKSLGTELCVGCHRGFVSADMNMPVHLSGLDEPGAWRSSAWAGNGMGRVDKVAQQTCIDCHMAREAAGSDEVSAHGGQIASHRFLGGHTWMAAMRGDDDQVRRLQAKLEGAASIDIAGALVDGRWHLPADGAPITPGSRASVDVVVRNLLVGHRFPGGVLDIQDTWIEVELADRDGKRLAESGLRHATAVNDDDTHVLRTLVVDDKGEVLERHEMAEFRTQIATQTIAPRDAQAVRYAFDVPADAKFPLRVTARLRHRSRTLAMQAEVCRGAHTADGKAFIRGAKGARSVVLDPCKPQPITLIAEASAQLGAGAVVSNARPAWSREYEHGMALVATVSERTGEAKAVLETALASAPVGTPRAMILVQLAQVASKQGRADDALALIAEARAYFVKAPTLAELLHGVPNVDLAHVGPPVLDATAADALMRVWRWGDATEPARVAASKAPGNASAWMVLARCLGSVGDNAAALLAATTGLELAPRDTDLLRSQATALAALHRPEAAAALAAYDRFRSPDDAAELRITCAADSARCAREREAGHTHQLHPVR
ncbi:MAG TPA: multiheme c-type cytochrome [Kofleriaceae bacterium]|jgi:Flp pilus assembly protein TadD|nr:multiheme c-type cytochrome [Kofleriaceae bacterium]